jgi:uncharacterized protein (DUF2141 family)
MLKRLLQTALVAGALAAPGASHAGTAKLVIVVEGLRSSDGVVDIALFDGAASFLDSDKRIGGGKAVIKDGAAIIEIGDLSPGRYAAAFYHDENGNGDFDQGLFGIPLEGYGFTNNARAIFSAPSFDEAALVVEQGRNEVRARIQY